jgi:PAS domain S-box-containing protein
MADKIEYERLEREALLSILLETEKLANVGGWEWDIIKDVWTFSDNWLHIHGCKKRHLSTAELLPIAHPDDRAKIQKAFDKAVSEGTNYEIEHRIIKQDTGEERYIRACGAPRFDNAGKLLKLYGSAQDITAQELSEKALEKERSLFKTIVDRLPVMITRYDPDAKMLFLNSEFEKKVGWKTEEVQNIDMMEKVYPDPEYRQKAAEYMQKASTDWREFNVTTKSGQTIVSEWSNIRLEDGTQIGIGLDITERKKIEASQIKSESLFRGLYDNMTSGSAIYEVMNDGSKGSDYIIKNFNEKSLEIEGKTLNQVVGKSLFDLRPNIDDYGLIEVMRKVWQTGKPDTFPVKIYQDERFSSYYENHIFKLPTGEVVTIYNDVTDQKNAEKALRKSEEKFSKFFYSSPTWLAFTRLADGKFLEINAAFEKITGFSRDEILGRNSLEIGLWRETEKRERLMKEAREKYGFQEQEVTFFTREGIPMPALWSSVVVEMDGDDCLLSTVMDISELKRAEEEKVALQKELQQTHKMEAIGNLAGGIAHEFNNVLGIILGNAELALDDVPDRNPAKESLKEIRKASFRAKEVVRQILSFARKTMTALKPLEINTIVKESIKLMRASIPAMVDIQPNIPSVPSMISGDPTEIHQIVINLCTNAAHAMKKTGGILQVGISEVTLDERTASRYEDLSPGDFIKLTVRDSGEGIEPDILGKVFEPYFTTKEFGAGSGMGLSVVYGIVKKYKGAINIESSLGEGTNVQVLFPKIEGEAPAKDKKEGELPRGEERILLVDDDPSIVNMVRQMLERLGYRVTGVSDSVSALERFRSAPDDFDLVITDMSMPKMSGDQLAAELMKIRNDFPILLCTGHSDDVDEKKARQMGIKGFAMKPLDMGKLARAVRSALNDR